jgi:hypothetical protein
VELAEHTGKDENQSFFVEKREHHAERSRCRREDIIGLMDLKEIGCMVMDWIHLAQVRVQRRLM